MGMRVKNPKKRSIGAPALYPWGKWLRVGARHRLVAGKNFKCTSHAMTIYLYQRAKQAGVVIKISHQNDNVLAIQVTGRRRKSA